MDAYVMPDRFNGKAIPLPYLGSRLYKANPPGQLGKGFKDH